MQTTIQKIATLVGSLMLVLITVPFLSSADDAEAGNKITICHATGSANHPYNEITISVNGLNGHSHHSGDIIPTPAGGCSGPVVPAPTVTLMADPSFVTTGTAFASLTATWSSTDATTCTASTDPTNSDWTGARALSGSLPVSFTMIGAGDFIEFTLTLTCTGPGGTASATTTVFVENETPT